MCLRFVPPLPPLRPNQGGADKRRGRQHVFRRQLRPAQHGGVHARGVQPERRVGEGRRIWFCDTAPSAARGDLALTTAVETVRLGSVGAENAPHPK